MSAVRVIARDRRDTLGEGPSWSARENAVYWVDILGRRLSRLSIDDDSVCEWEMPEPIGWVIERENAPGFIAGFQSGFAELTLDPVAITPIADPEPDKPDNRMNDAKADAAGRIWAGTMPFDCDKPSGALYRLDPDRSWRRMDEGYIVANGPAISGDGRTLYHTDSGKRTVYRLALGADGSLGAREQFIRFPDDWGAPDGMTCDAEDGLWIAHWAGGRVSRFTRDGLLDRAIELPASQITSCAFAGPELDRMFVTSAADGVNEAAGGALFEVDPGVRGLPPHRFKG